MNAWAQASLEYLLLLAAFFSFFALVLPVIIDISQQVIFSSDDFLAKQIASDLNEQVGLLNFLGEGSERTLVYSPAQRIIIYSQGTNLVIDSGRKQFLVGFDSKQNFLRQDFNKGFSLVLRKTNTGVQLSVSN